MGVGCIWKGNGKWHLCKKFYVPHKSPDFDFTSVPGVPLVSGVKIVGRINTSVELGMVQVYGYCSPNVGEMKCGNKDDILVCYPDGVKKANTIMCSTEPMSCSYL